MTTTTYENNEQLTAASAKSDVAAEHGIKIVSEGIQTDILAHQARPEVAQSYQDYLIPLLKELSLKNFQRFKRYPSSLMKRTFTREYNVSKRCAKKAIRSKNKENFEAQMFSNFSVPLKLDEQQFNLFTKLSGEISEFMKKTVDVSSGKPRLNLANEGVSGLLSDIGIKLGSSLFQGVKESVLESFGECKDDVMNILVVLSLSSAVGMTFHRYGNGKEFNASLLLSSVALALYFKKDILSCVTSLFSFFKKEENDNENEIFHEAQLLDVTTLSDIVSTFLIWGMFPNLKNEKASIMKMVSEIGRNLNGVESFVGFSVRIFQKILDYVAVKLGFSSFSILSTMIPKVDEWVTDAREFIQEFSSNKLPRDRITFERCLSLEDRAYEIISLYANQRSGSNISALVRPLMREITSVRISMHQDGVGQNKTRQAPLMVSFAGQSQIGKSSMLRPFIIELLTLVCSDEEIRLFRRDLDANIYSRQPEHDFWDGYHGQFICFLDEKDLVREDLLTPNNANTDIIRMGNIFPNVLHMAGIEQKGNVHFRSKVVLATTNVESAEDGARRAVRHPQAVVNRLHFEVIVKVKREFAHPEDVSAGLEQKFWRLDPMKLIPEEGFQRGVHDYFLLKRKVKPETPGQYATYEEGPFSYDDLLFMCARKYKELEKRSFMTVVDDNKAFERAFALKEKFSVQMGESNYFSFLESFSSSDFVSGSLQRAAILSSSVTLERLSNFDKMCEFMKERPGLIFEPGALRFVSDRLSEKHMDDYLSMLSDLDLEEIQTELLIFSGYYDHEVKYVSFREKIGRKFCGLFEAARGMISDLYKEVEFMVCSFFDNNTIFHWKSLCMVDNKIGAVLNILSLASFVYYAFQAYDSLLWWGTDLLSGEKNAASSAEEKGEEIVAQVGDPGLDDVVNKVWSNSYYSMKFEGDTSVLGWGFFSAGNTFNMCAHYLNVWESRGYDNEKIIFENHSGCSFSLGVGFMIKNKRLVDQDWVRFDVPSVRLHPDITPLFSGRDVLKNRTRGKLMMMRVVRGVPERYISDYEVDYRCVYADPSGAQYRLPVTLRYDIPTRKGECGLPVFLIDPTTRHQKFVGFHVAGSSKSGMCQLLDVSVLPGIEAQGAYVPRTMKIIGEVERAVGSAGISSIRKSPLHEAWGPAKKSPAHLSRFVSSDGALVRPMEKALQRYDQPILYYDEKLVDACAREAVRANINTFAFRERPVRISLEQAVVGIPGVEFMESLNRSTSPGYPWNMKPRPGYKGKERFMGKNVDIDMSGPDWPLLETEVNECLSLLERGERPNWYFTDSLKDELLKHEKVESGDTRMFCPSPVSYQILFGMFFKDFQKKFMDSRILGEHAVGVNVYSAEWDLLFRKVTKFGTDQLVAGDFKSFDALQSAQILRIIGEHVIESFADREFDGIRRLLWCEVWDSRHIVGKTIYQWLQSLPSGHPMTTLVNCLFVGTVMRMAWVSIHGDRISSLREFTEKVALVAYGDDNVLGICPSVSGVFNQHSITEAMARLGLKYTPEDKSSNPPPLRSVFEIEFLKRSFRLEPLLGRIVAPLRLETVLEMPYWTKKEGFEEIWRTNLDNAIREMALHDKDTFDRWVPVMIDACVKKTGYTPVSFSREVLLDEISNKEAPYCR